MNCIKKKIEDKRCGDAENKNFKPKGKDTKPEQDDSGFDTCDSSDERKHRQLFTSTSINNKTNIASKKGIINRT